MATLVVVEDIAGPAVIGRGGQAMRVMAVLEGLRRLGHEVLFLEFLGEEPSPASPEYFRRAVGSWWELDRAALIDGATGSVLAGADRSRVEAIVERADAVVFLSAIYRRDPWPLVAPIRPRILWEQDPGYTHLWAQEGDPAEVFGEHDVHFTVGLNVGTGRCALPTSGLDWRPLPPPVILDWWPGAPIVGDRFTTIAGWRDYGYLEWEGEVVGPKDEEWRKFIDLPARAGERIELALSIEDDDPDQRLLAEHGWLVERPSVAADPGAYRDWIAESTGEFSCAKGGYVATRSGWFSDRSACYLAAGRPVVVQSTGFEDVLPTGEGLFAVPDVDAAAAAIRAIRSDYARHSAAAREIAREHLDAERVLPRLLEPVGVGA
jgi:hypothetical protein